MTYTILDLFCGAGGAAKGYHDAGFEVIGIDLSEQPRYPYRFVWDDALQALETLAYDGCYLLPPRQRDKGRCIDLFEIDAIHASPPCQGYSALAACWPDLASTRS